ncbi:MAG: hypothetical protein UY04_C0013G0006 [Parcubacteria group bacterium GW2011_GWA2_47_7]|nr:MAG: hypothetical protein UY04_C0013G0006 [Parcubacteria group bacterium GW2011_GWA2_47_7]
MSRIAMNTPANNIRDEALLEIEELIREELSARKAKANACFERERKASVSRIGKSCFVLTLSVAIVCFFFALLWLHDPNQQFVAWRYLSFVVGSILLIPIIYLRKRNRAFQTTFKSCFPNEARLLGLK